jgi:hypothetical protein
MARPLSQNSTHVGSRYVRTSPWASMETRDNIDRVLKHIGYVLDECRHAVWVNAGCPDRLEALPASARELLLLPDAGPIENAEVFIGVTIPPSTSFPGRSARGRRQDVPVNAQVVAYEQLGRCLYCGRPAATERWWHVRGGVMKPKPHGTHRWCEKHETGLDPATKSAYRSIASRVKAELRSFARMTTTGGVFID